MTWRARLAQIVEETLGIAIAPAVDAPSVDRWIEARVAQLGLADEDAYLDRLSDPSGAELARLTDIVAIGHTCFFRIPDQLRALGVMLGEATQPVRVWCAACSTGPEPYSVAMMLDHLGIAGTVLATDINPRALEAARQARYSAWDARKVPVDIRRTAFQELDGGLVVRSHIRERVRFARHNFVIEPPPATGTGTPWDLILCRNALIYFSGPTVERALGKLLENLSPRGYLVLSPADLPTGHALVVPRLVSGSVAWIRAERACAVDRRDGPVPRQALAPAPAPRHPPRSSPGFADVLARLDGGDLDGARRLLIQVVASDGGVREWTTLGNLHLRARAFDEAEEAYLEAARRDPLSAEVHLLLGVLYRKVEDLERATSSLRTALFLEPGFWEGSFLLAGVYHRQGKVAERRRDLANTLRLVEADPTPRVFVSSGHDTLRPSAVQVAASCRRSLGRSR